MQKKIEEIRQRIMGLESTDIRQEVIDLCEILKDMATKLAKIEQTAAQASRTASCLANGMSPDC